MTDEFANRLNSFLTALTFANDPGNQPVWQNQVPKSFGTKIGELATEVAALQDWAQQQSESIAGEAEAKEKEEGELEVAAFEMAQALVAYFIDQNQLAAAEPFRRAFSWWQGLRDQDLLARSQAVIDAATPLTTGQNAATIAEDYGISSVSVAALVAERDDYVAVQTAPASARSGRKGYSVLMREKFRPVKAKFRDLDRLVPQFRKRPGGEAFVSGWFAARQVINAGHGPGTGGTGGGTGTVPAKATIGSVSQVSPGDWVLYGVAATGATSFKIEERVDGGAWAQLAQGVPAGDYVVGARTTPGAYQWRAIGVNASGAGPASDPVSATVTLPALTAIGIESAVSVPNGSGSNDLQVTYAATGGEAATSAELRIQPPGEDPLIVVPLVRPSQTVAGTFQTGTQVTLQTAAIRGTEVVLGEALTLTV